MVGRYNMGLLPFAAETRTLTAKMYNQDRLVKPHGLQKYWIKWNTEVLRLANAGKLCLEALDVLFIGTHGIGAGICRRWTPFLR